MSDLVGNPEDLFSPVKAHFIHVWLGVQSLCDHRAKNLSFKPSTAITPHCTGLEVIKLFSNSAQLSMKFQLLINVEIVKNCGKFRFKTSNFIYPAHKC